MHEPRVVNVRSKVKERMKPFETRVKPDLWSCMNLQCLRSLPVRCKSFSLRFQAGSNPLSGSHWSFWQRTRDTGNAIETNAAAALCSDLTNTVPSPEYPNGAITAMVVIQLSSTNNVKWTGADLTKKTKGPLADSSNGAVAFATTPNKQVHVYYVSDGHVNQLFLPTPATTWQNEDLAALTHGGLAIYTGEMAGLSIGNEQYVYYIAQ
jgi:hypothetical protein